jgi:formylglycine-generating enzyme required for sulfatase activity
VFLTLLCYLMAQAALAGGRAALVIGNGAYQNAPALANPAHDATDIAAALRRLHYSVQLVTDVRKLAMDSALQRFAREAAGADLLLIYYSGHGIEAGGINYLLPVDARLESEASVPREAVSLPTVMGVATRARQLGVVVLDACRNNPLASRLRRAEGTRSISRAGLAPVEPAGDLLVAFATRHGHVAADGTGRNSPYTAAILETLRVPGLEVDLFFRKVRDRVLAETHSRQEPFTYGSLGAEQLYLNPPAEGLPPRPPQDPSAPERMVWQSAQRLGTVAAYRDYLAKYPAGRFSTEARRQVATLGRTVPAAAPGTAAQAHEQSTLAQRAGKAFRDCPGCPQMVMLPAGEFEMGDPENGFARPQHRVQVAAFAIGRYAITFDDWAACVTAHGCSGRTLADGGYGRGSRPVINVSWNDSQEYVRWLARRSAHAYRLPSEAEWEYAARAGTTNAYYWGSAVGSGHANCIGCGSRWDNHGTAPVGSFAPNPWGLSEMLGNVSQWVQDCWHGDYAGAPADGRAWEMQDGCIRVQRGGSFLSTASNVTTAARYPCVVQCRSPGNGLRVARSG